MTLLWPEGMVTSTSRGLERFAIFCEWCLRPLGFACDGQPRVCTAWCLQMLEWHAPERR